MPATSPQRSAGALDRASTAVQVGWGRASAADIAALAELHAVEFRILARPEGDAVTMISGHDTHVASLGGLLGLHWSVPGLSADGPAPGGAIVFERLDADRRVPGAGAGGAVHGRAVHGGAETLIGAAYAACIPGAKD